MLSRFREIIERFLKKHDVDLTSFDTKLIWRLDDDLNRGRKTLDEALAELQIKMEDQVDIDDIRDFEWDNIKLEIERNINKG